MDYTGWRESHLFPLSRVVPGRDFPHDEDTLRQRLLKYMLNYLRSVLPVRGPGASTPSRVKTTLVWILRKKRGFLQLLEHLRNAESDLFLHHLRVAGNCVLIGEIMHMRPADLHDTCIAALAHDIGKLGLHDTLFSKKARLTPEEFDIIKDHIPLGIHYLRSFTDICAESTIGRVMLCHHENYKGNGYPVGIRGDDIPLGARILRVADVYDSLLSPRSYKFGYPDELVQVIMQEMAADCFDPGVYSAFRSRRALFRNGNITPFSNKERESDVLSERDRLSTRHMKISSVMFG